MEQISASQVKQRLDAGEKMNLVDVREPFEHAEFNIGGVLLPIDKVQTMQLEEIENLRGQEIIIYCRSGNRSVQACLYLEMMGFSNLKNLTGGLVEWKNLS